MNRNTARSLAGELGGKRLSIVSMRCSPEVALGLRARAAIHGMSVSDYLNTLATRNLMQGKPGGQRCSVGEQIERLQESYQEASEDGVIDLQESWELTDLLIEANHLLAKVREREAVPA